MLLQQSFQQPPGGRFSPGLWRREAAAQPSPRQNHLLAALPPEDYERLLPDLKPVPLPQGWTIHGAGERERHLYFPTAGIVSRHCLTASGASAESAVTGSEGVIGVASFLGGHSTPGIAVVLSAGHAFRLGSGFLAREFDHDGPLPRLLLRYTLALMVQTGQVAVCNRHHSLEQRLSRWILSCMDRIDSNELMTTHELIAELLGVRREGVTEAAGNLQRAGMIHYSRGRMAVLDRRRLEARSCECYAVLRREHQRLIRQGGAMAGSGVHGAFEERH